MDVDAGLQPPPRSPGIRFRVDTRSRLDGLREELAVRGLESTARSHMRQYKIVCKVAEYPGQADTYVVIYVPSGEGDARKRGRLISGPAVGPTSLATH